MKCYAILAATALVLSTAGASAYALPASAKDATAPHVRALDPAGVALLADAQQKSATVRDLAQQLESGNLVVYVQVTSLPKDGPQAGLRFVGATAAERYVMISIAGDLAADRQMELLGHELTNATDVARARWVASDSQFQTYMSLVGWRNTSQATGYETSKATAIERQVRLEIATRRPQ